MAEEKCKEYAKHCQERSGLVDSYILRPEQKLKQSPPAFYMSQGFNLHPALLVLSSASDFTWLIHLFFLARYPVLVWRWWRATTSYGSLFQCLITFTVERLGLISHLNLSDSNFHVLVLANLMEKGIKHSVASLFFSLQRYLCPVIKSPLNLFERIKQTDLEVTLQVTFTNPQSHVEGSFCVPV